jgi:hypothetical protein
MTGIDNILAEVCRPRLGCTYPLEQDVCEAQPRWRALFTCDQGHQFNALVCRGHFRAMASGQDRPGACGQGCGAGEYSITTRPIHDEDA